jgi:hypothetical protein
LGLLETYLIMVRFEPIFGLGLDVVQFGLVQNGLTFITVCFIWFNSYNG